MFRFQGFLFGIIAFGISATGYSAGTIVTPYDQVKARMAAVAARNPDLVSRIVLGINDQGVEIEGLRIGQPLGNVINHLVVGAHHGNEQKSTDVALAFIDQMVKKKKRHGKMAVNFDNVVVHVIPVLNVSGYNANRREETDGSGRSFDPNRDYPDPCGNSSVFNLNSTEALSKYMISENIVGAVTIHGYIGTFTFPWGTYTEQTMTPDHEIFQTVTAQATRVNRYRTGTHADVIYPTVGAFEDWSYHALGVWTVLLEVKNNPNVVQDASSLVAYFAAIPLERSQYHEHLGACNESLGLVRSRP